MTTSSWGLGRRIGFRFTFLLTAFLVVPFPLSVLPKMDWLENAWSRLWSIGVGWLAQRVFDLPDPPWAFNGSGDRTFDYLQLLLMLVVAALGTLVWSIAESCHGIRNRFSATTAR